MSYQKFTLIGYVVQCLLTNTILTLFYDIGIDKEQRYGIDKGHFFIP